MLHYFNNTAHFVISQDITKYQNELLALHLHYYQ